MRRAFIVATASWMSAWLAPAMAWAQDTEDIRDIRGPIFDPAPFWTQLVPHVAVALGLAALTLVAWLVRRLLTRAKSPEKIALARLAAARSITDPRVFAVEASEAVREYVEARFEVHAPQQTTEELLAQLAEDPSSPLASHRASLSEFLGECDRAKFGGYALDHEMREALADTARAFVSTSARPEAKSSSSSSHLAPGAAT